MTTTTVPLRTDEFLRPTTANWFASTLNELAAGIHQSNVEAGWWNDLTTGAPLKRNMGELLCLVHSEISEAMEADRKDLRDDKLVDRPGLEVELADAVIRIFDIAGSRGLDLGGALMEKWRFNRTRADHQVEARRAADGKKY